MDKTASFARHQAVGAYRRWEPPDFGETRPRREAAPGIPPDTPPAAAQPKPPAERRETNPAPPISGKEKGAEAAPPPPPPPPSIKLPTAAEIEQIHEDARRSGFEEGFGEGLAEGREKGYDEGKETGFKEGREAGFSEGKAAAEDEARQMHDLVAQLQQSFGQLDTEIAEELMSLAVELSRKILQHTLAVEPEALVSAIRAILQTLPQMHTQIYLNPDDMALVRSYLDELPDPTGHLLIEDENVSRGGCRVETPGAQIDATMETRWRRVIESLGREHAPWTPVSERRTKTRRAGDKAGTKKTSRKEAAAPAPAPDEAAEPTQ